MSLVTVHVVRRGHPGVLIPPVGNGEKHVVAVYGQAFTGIIIGTAYVHDLPETTEEIDWFENVLKTRMAPRSDIRRVWPPTLPTVPHLN